MDAEDRLKIVSNFPSEENLMKCLNDLIDGNSLHMFRMYINDTTTIFNYNTPEELIGVLFRLSWTHTVRFVDGSSLACDILPVGTPEGMTTNLSANVVELVAKIYGMIQESWRVRTKRILKVLSDASTYGLTSV